MSNTERVKRDSLEIMERVPYAEKGWRRRITFFEARNIWCGLLSTNIVVNTDMQLNFNGWLKKNISRPKHNDTTTEWRVTFATTIWWIEAEYRETIQTMQFEDLDGFLHLHAGWIALNVDGLSNTKQNEDWEWLPPAR